MFCKNCGAQIDDKAVVCPHCGVAVNNSIVADDAPSGGFAVLCFFFPIVGLILYLVWHENRPLKARSCGKGAIIGVCVNVLLVILSVVLSVVFYGCVLASLVSAVSGTASLV